jgi:GNAT superfamily N-acetyltransferase
MIVEIPQLIGCFFSTKRNPSRSCGVPGCEISAFGAPSSLSLFLARFNAKTGCTRRGLRVTMTGMGWQTTGDVAEFLAAAREYLTRERARNTVILTVSEQLRVNRAAYSLPAGASESHGTAIRPLFGWWTGQAGVVGGAFMHTPPHPLLLSAVPANVAEGLAAALAGRPLRGVNGHVDAAEAFAAAWRAASPRGRTAEQRRLRLYRLGELAWPEPAPDGAPRVAANSDAPLLTDWFAAFVDEVHDTDAGEDQAAGVRDKLSHGGILVWEAGGRPVSIAGVTRQVAGMLRVGPVYTPPELRGHGYASAVTAAASLRAREAGAQEVLLYTDLANPTSNSIYQRIGYRPVEDRVVLAFFTH